MANPAIGFAVFASSQYPEASHALLQSISDVIVDLLVEQWRAGASILQVFESHAGELPPARFIEFSGKYLLDIAARVRARVPEVAQGEPLVVNFLHHLL